MRGVSSLDGRSSRRRTLQASARNAAAGEPAGLVPELVRPARDLIENLPVGTMVLDPERRVVGVNARLLADLGLPKDFWKPGESLAQLTQRAAMQGEPALIALGDTLAQVDSNAAGTETPDCEIVTRTGIHLEVRIVRSDGGGFIMTLARRAGPAPADRLRMLDDIVSHQHGVLFRRVVKRDGRVVMDYVSTGVKDVLGITAEELIAARRDLFSFVDPDERGKLESTVRKYNRKPGRVEFEFPIITPDKARRVVLCTGRTFHTSKGETVWDGRLMYLKARLAIDEDRRRVRQLLDSVVENIPHVVSVRRASDSTYVLFNKAGEDFFGIRREELIGKVSHPQFLAELAKSRREWDRRVIETGKPAEYPDYLVHTADGAERIVKTRKFPLFDGNGKVEYILSISEDITEQRRAQEALTRSEERFRDIAQSASDWFWETDADMRFVDITMGAAASKSFDISKMNGRTREELALREDLAEESEKWARYAEDIRNRRPIRDFVYRVRLPHRKIGYVRASGSPFFSEDGEFLGYRGAATDITPEIEAKAKAAQAQNQLLEAIECFSDGFALFDADDRLVLCNNQYRQTWPGMENLAVPGVTFEELVRSVAKSVDLPFGYPTVESYISERLAAHNNPPNLREQQFRDGRWVEISNKRTSEGGVVVTSTEITAHKEREDSLRRTGREALRAKEAAEIASRAKSEFLANMSHELRTPLNAIIGFSEIIKDEMMGDMPNQSYREYASDIHNSGRHLLELINDILDMSKIEAGKLDLAEEDIDVREIVESCIVLVRERAEKNQISLGVSVPDDLPRLRADVRKLKQILINLLSNSVKFTESGGSVRVEGEIDGDGAFVMRVIDTGIGMKPDEIGKALEPFGQIDSGLNRSYEGTGLGLTLTKALVELHGGSLEISSRTGDGPTGTTVTTVFPAERMIED